MVIPRSKGFTLVELAIVIVVIGIIAGLTVVGYKGLQVKARNNTTAEVVQSYVDALVVYHTKKGKYPDANGTNPSCLGLGYPNGKCWVNNVDENASFMNQLQTVAGENRLPANLNLASNGVYFQPTPPAWAFTLDGVAENFVVYTLEGSTKCSIGPVASDMGDGNIFTFSSTPPADGRTSVSTYNEFTVCWIPLSLVK